ncbi:hypothetical protein RBA41_31235 [Massilia sp. CCM 9210]|uniref:hypothetical protein n=1 Tax=Massilia scottii TaxID=3057166 RepID=UPI0027967331|nr:hypothetical protein [Massilia sp. CCM 9210]MDQ1817784.1 hypothetical protein [Massilia sp. CCM 9210]
MSAALNEPVIYGNFDPRKMGPSRLGKRSHLDIAFDKAVADTHAKAGDVLEVDVTGKAQIVAHDPSSTEIVVAFHTPEGASKP